MSIDGGAIDTDHKFLISLINDFDAEFEKGFDQYRILDALKRLEYYTVYHFAREEAIQQQVNFPHYKEHADQHRHLRMNVKGALNLFSQEIPKSGQAAVKKRVGDLLRLWIMGHITKFDKELRPFVRRRSPTQAVKPMQGSGAEGPEGYRIPFSETGKALVVQVVATKQFVGISFRGHGTQIDSVIMGKACEAINASSSSTIVASMQELKDFDDYFIGHLLTLFGTFKEGNRVPYLVTGSSGPCMEKLHRLGIDRIIRSFPSHTEFYEEIGFRAN